MSTSATERCGHCGEPLATGTHPQRIDYVVHHDASRPSRLLVPVAEGSEP